MARRKRKNGAHAETYNKWFRNSIVPAATPEQHTQLYEQLLLDPETILTLCEQMHIPLGCLDAFQRAQGSHPDLMRDVADAARGRGLPVQCPHDCEQCSEECLSHAA